METRMIVCGGVDFNDYDFFNAETGKGCRGTMSYLFI